MADEGLLGVALISRKKSVLLGVLAASAIACEPSSEPVKQPRPGELVATAASPLPKGLVCGLSYNEATDEWKLTAGVNSTAKFCFDNDNGGGGFHFTVNPVGVATPNPFCSGTGFAITPGLTVFPSIDNVTSHHFFVGSCNNIPTVTGCGAHPVIMNGTLSQQGTFCTATATPQADYQLHVASDADDAYKQWIFIQQPAASQAVPGGQTAPGPWGFVYQAYAGGTVPAATGSAGSDRFVLPKGAACGLAHTKSSPAAPVTGIANDDPGCMGFNPLDPSPGLRCPPGWASRYMFDMNSGQGNSVPPPHPDCGDGLSTQPYCGFWGWCEYQDPHNLCDSKCMRDAVLSGVAINLTSDTDTTGNAWCGTGTDCSCYGGGQSPYFDQGRSAGDGLGWCGTFSVSHEGVPGPLNVAAFCASQPGICQHWKSLPDSVSPEICESYCLGSIGCFQDTPARVLPLDLGPGKTVETCEQAALNAGYLYAGVEFGGECFAGNSIDGLTQIRQGACAMPCTANTNEYCGGSWAMNIYHSSGAPAPVSGLNVLGSASIKVPGAISIVWSAPPPASSGYTPSGYNVYKNGAFLRTVAGTSLQETALPDGSNTYLVKAVNAVGESDGVTGAGTAEHCDPNTCTGCCSGNTCLGGNQLSTGCVAGGNVCGGACAAGNVCSNGACACAPLTLAQACGGSCGTAGNGCGGTYNCGACSPPPPTCKNCVQP